MGLALLAVALLGAGAAAVQTSPMARKWATSEGGQIDPFKPGRGKASVLIFLLTDCPMANSYAPEFARIMETYSAKGVEFSLVYVDPEIDSSSAKAHGKDYGLKARAILDPSHSLAKAAGVTVSPEAVVMDAKAKIVYRGRIDDRAVDYGKVRPKPVRQDLRLTLDAVLQGKPVPVSKTKAIGCILTPL